MGAAAMSVKIGVSGASVMAREGRDTFLRYLDTLEELEWDSVWFSDRIVGPAWRMDPMAGMAITAARTEKLKFGTGVLLMSMRSPVTAAAGSSWASAWGRSPRSSTMPWAWPSATAASGWTRRYA
jgi:hypothetical protein